MSEQPRAIVGLRERKKADTKNALSAAAVRLAYERGLENVTASAIAAAADVSPRTFFNYFTSKEDAVVGSARDEPSDLVERIRERPAHEAPLEALHRAVTANLVEFGERADAWAQRRQLVQRYPSLAVRHVGALARAERQLIEEMARRTGLDPDRDIYPAIVVTAGLGAARTAIAIWYEVDRAVPLPEVVDQAFDLLEGGLVP